MDFVKTEHHHYIALGALAIAGLAYLYAALTSPLAKIPGPWYTKFTRAFTEYQWLRGNRPRYVHALHKKYGPVVRVGPNEVDVMDVPSAKEIHTVKATYTKSSWYERFRAPGNENVFSTTDVEFHRRHRKLLSGGFSETSLKGFEPIIEERVQLAIQRMGEEMKTRGAADIFKWWLFMATDVIGELTFGESFRMLERGEKNDYTSKLEKTAVASSRRSTFPVLAKLALYGVPIPGFQDNTQVVKGMIKYATESLQRYKKIVENDPKNPPPTLFTRLFQGEEEESLTFRELLNEAQGFIIAGSDTTALTLTYLVWAVCHNTAVRERLAREVQDDLPADFTDHDLQQLPYLGQVIEEALRLYPAAPNALPRVVPPGGATLAGHFLPGGSTVCTQAYSLHRSPEVFPDPEVFNPDRWASPTKEMKDSLMPFGGGSRICIGMHLARRELRLATALFFRAFPRVKMSTREDMCDDDMHQKIFFLVTPKGKRCLVEAS